MGETAMRREVFLIPRIKSGAGGFQLVFFCTVCCKEESLDVIHDCAILKAQLEAFLAFDEAARRKPCLHCLDGAKR